MQKNAQNIEISPPEFGEQTSELQLQLNLLTTTERKTEVKPPNPTFSQGKGVKSKAENQLSFSVRNLQAILNKQ